MIGTIVILSFDSDKPKQHRFACCCVFFLADECSPVCQLLYWQWSRFFVWQSQKILYTDVRAQRGLKGGNSALFVWKICPVSNFVVWQRSVQDNGRSVTHSAVWTFNVFLSWLLMDAERMEENVQCWQNDQTVSQTVCFPFKHLKLNTPGINTLCRVFVIWNQQISLVHKKKIKKINWF